MHRTQSATQLTVVQIEAHGPGTSVWLRRNIQAVDVDLGDGLSQTMWEADEVSGVVDHAVAADEIEGDFDAWWAVLERAAMTDEEREDELRGGLSMVEDALADLSVSVSDGASDLSDVMDAIAELSEMVSELVVGGDE